MKRVVIIGGGFAGSTLAKILQDKFNVMLVDDKTYFEFTPSVLRAIAQPECEKKIHVPHGEYLHNAKIVNAKVKDITEKYIVANGKKIKYDYLVVATGSSYKAPFKYPKVFLALRTRELASLNKKIMNSSKIAVIGGGVVGTELAAEIVHYFPGKEITLISSRGCLLDRLPFKAQQHAFSFMERNNVKIVCDDRVREHNKDVLLTEKGKRIGTDIAFACIGITPNSDLLKKNFRDKVTQRGFVEVDEHLRLQGEKRIFIAGDLANIDEEKTAQNAERHAKLIADNIELSEKGKELSKYTKKSTPMVISLGPRDGIFAYGNFVMTGMIPAIMKWFVERKEMWKKRN